MSDFKRIRDNVQNMINQSADPDVIEDYLGSEGFNLREYNLANQNFGTFMSAVKRGGKNIGSLVADWAPIMGATALEKLAPDAWKPSIQSYKERQMKEAVATQEEIAKKLPAEYESYKEIEGVGDALGYAKEAIGESLASFLPGIVTGGVGSVLSRGAVAKAGQVAGEAARKGTLEAAKEAAERNVPGAAEEFVSGIAEQRAGAAGIEAAKRAMYRTELGRDVANTFIGSAAINIPDAYQSIYSETGQETLLPAFAAGSFNALLDSFTPVNVLRAAKGKGITGEAIMGAWYKRAAAGLGKGALTEGVTEGLQEITNAAAEAFVAEHDNIFTPENLTRFIDSAIRGAIAGGGVQAVTEGVMGKQAPPPVPPPPPSQPLQPPLGTPAPLLPGISGPAPVTPLQVESVPGEAGPGVQPVRDLAGPVPEGTLPQDREPIIDPETGRITGYREVYVPPGPPELEGEQGRLELPPQVGETGFLFEETPPQPTPAEPTEPPARAKEAEAPQPIKDLIPEIVVAAKKDPTASKILKGNNTASANAVVQKIESFMETPEADPVAAMEKLYQADRDGTYPAGVKPLTDAQRELLETTYKQLTGNDIEGVMQQRQFATAEQGELFAETPAPEAPQAPAKFASPEEAWAFHRNDDHPEFSDLTPPEQEAWKQYVAMNRGSASNFQEIVKAHTERTKTVSPPAVTPGVALGAGPSITGIPGMREVPGITPGAQQNIANQIRGKQAIQVAEWIGQNGPVQFRELGKAIANRLKFFKSQGFEYRFTVLSPERGAAMLRGGTAGRHRFTSDPGVFKSSITLPPQTSTVETVLHELLHAATTPAILYIEQGYAKNTDLGKLIQELDDVAQFALKTLIDRVNSGVATPFEQAVFTGPMNSLGNIDRNRANIKREIISWSMTNPDMQMFMESIPYKGKNLFSAIVEAFRKFLGLSPRADTALYEVMRLTNEILNANYSDMQRAANEAGIPLPTPKAKKGEPKAGAEQVEYMVSTNTPAFRQWFRKSKIVNPDGTPKIMYHGTRYDIKRFKNKITFVSPSTWVANKFAANDMWWTEGKPVDEGANVIPLFVRAENPFDFENPKHVKQVAARVREFAREGGFDPYRNPGIKRKIADISGGSWTAIEEPLVWDAITDLGFDGAYLTEFGVKNLAVFDRNQLKSAIKSEFGPGEEIDLQTIAAPAGKFVGAPPPKQTTKLQPAPSTKQTVQNAANNAVKAFESDWWTKWRVGWVDVGAGLSKRLKDLPVFDKDGKLRADLLIRAASQTINLIKTGLQSGIPVLNADGTIVIQRDANNIGRSQQLADALDDNAVVKASGLSGRGFVAEIARALTGEEIINLDAKRRQEAATKLGAARAQMQSALDQYKKGQISRTTLERIASKVKAIRKRYQPDLKLDREKQVTPENIAWAKANLAAVPEVQEILNIWKNINDSLLDLWVNTGLMTAETRDMFRRDRPNYVPLYAAREDLMAEEQEGYTGKAAGAKTVAEIERLEGSDKTRNLWENMDKHYAFMTAKAYNNHTRKMAVEQLMKFGIDSARITKAGDDRTNLRYRDYNNPDADASGIVHVIVDNPLDVAAFQTLPNQLGPIMKAMSASTQVLRATALINPMYWVKQLIRDPIHSSIAGQLDTIVTPFHAMKEYIQILANNSEEARILAERGVIGQIDPTISLQEYLKQVGTEKIKPSMVSEWSKKLMRMHEASDAATRVAIFKNEKAYALKELGMSEKDATNYAVHKARESINFAVRGNSPTLNALRHMIPFFSAAITSLDTLYRTATGYGLNAEEKAQVQRIFVKRAAMMVALSTAYAMLIQDDEDYQKLPDNVKDDNWLLPSPVGSEHTFIKIPIPFEIGFLFKTIPEGLVRYMSDTSTGKEVLASYRRGFMRSMPGEGVFIPQAVKPGLEAVFNYSLFTGRPIEGMSDQGLPVEARGPNASEVAKMMSKFGLSEIGLSPAKIDYLIRGYMAELGSFTTGVASTMMTELSGKEPPAKNLENQVFFRAFLTDPNTSKAATDFYDIMQNSQEAVNMMNRLKKEGRVEELEEFISDEDRKKLIAIAPSLRGIQDQMAKIRARINQIKADYDRDPEDRREEINKLQTVYDTVARRGYKVLEAAGIER